MNWYNIVIITLLSFTIFNFLLIVYPLTFTRTKMKDNVRKSQYCFLICTVLTAIVIFIFSKQNITHILTGMDLASTLIIISGLITCLGILFIVCSLQLMKINYYDIKSLELLQQLVGLSIFSTNNVKDQLQNYVNEHENILNDYGIKHLLNLFVRQYSEMNRPPLDLGQFLLRKCMDIIYDSKQFVPIPFPNINILFSLSGVGVIITLLISLVP